MWRGMAWHDMAECGTGVRLLGGVCERGKEGVLHEGV